MSQGDSYHYEPLPPILERGRTPPFTRLLLLSPGSRDDPFEAQLQITDVERSPPYEALSYTWGSPAEQSRDYVWLQGRPMPIKPNLEDALRSLRLPNQVRRLWIDALCIDQSNLDERARQVQYMRLVYTHAARVVVWLGLKTPGTHEAFQAAKRLAEARNHTNPLARDPNSGPLDPETIQALAGSMLEGLPETAMAHLDEVFQREYFTRCWCIQEVVASSVAVVKMEDLEMSFFELIASLLMLARWKGEMALDRPWELWQKVLMARQPDSSTFGRPEVQGSIGSFLHLLELTRTLNATDNRDKIFSLLGICDEGINPVLALTQVTGNDVSWRLRLLRRGLKKCADFMNERGAGQGNFGRPAAMRPDYKKPTVRVYCDLTRFLLSKQPRVLDVLDHVSHNEEPGSGEYPSWVPKWFDRRTCFVFQGAFSAGFWSGRVPYIAELHDIPMRGDALRPEILSVGGYRADAVQKTSETFEFSPGIQAIVIPIVKAWTELFGMPMIPRREIQYRDGSLLDVAYLKAVTAGCLGAMVGATSLLTQQHGGLNPILDQSIIQEFEIQKDARTEDLAETFLAFLGQVVDSAGEQLEFEDPERAGKLHSFLAGAVTYSTNRRAFVTRDGRVGIGPRMMRPGDEVIVLYGGRMPFVVRPRGGGGSLLIGSCFMSDEELMWGNVTEKVKRNRGGPPSVTFEFH